MLILCQSDHSIPGNMLRMPAERIFQGHTCTQPFLEGLRADARSIPVYNRQMLTNASSVLHAEYKCSPQRVHANAPTRHKCNNIKNRSQMKLSLQT